MSSRHWGEIPNEPDTDSGIAAIEREQITKPRPVEVEGAEMPQPSASSEPDKGGVFNDRCPCAITIHSILLMEYYRAVQDLLCDARSASSQGSQEPQPSTSAKSDEPKVAVLPPPPPMPVLRECILTHRRPGDITGRNRELSDFVKGVGEPPMRLHYPLICKLLVKYSSTVFCHAGFKNTSTGTMATVASILEQFYLRLCFALRHNVDQEGITGNTGFIDVLQQTFYQIKLGNITSLHYYYQTRIVDYHQLLMRKCHAITAEYEKYRLPKSKSSGEAKIKKEKEQPSSEIKFPLSEETEESHQETSQIPLQLEELQGELQPIEQDTGAVLKDDSIKWPPGQSAKKEGAQKKKV